RAMQQDAIVMKSSKPQNSDISPPVPSLQDVTNINQELSRDFPGSNKGNLNQDKIPMRDSQSENVEQMIPLESGSKILNVEADIILTDDEITLLNKWWERPILLSIGDTRLYPSVSEQLQMILTQAVRRNIGLMHRSEAVSVSAKHKIFMSKEEGRPLLGSEREQLEKQVAQQSMQLQETAEYALELHHLLVRKRRRRRSSQKKSKKGSRFSSLQRSSRGRSPTATVGISRSSPIRDNSSSLTGDTTSTGFASSSSGSSSISSPLRKPKKSSV
ncbi:MAG: hypothetical protein EZS28_051762, partial [Streblomastix strix]